MIENYSEKWIGIEDAANHLGVTKDTIRNWIKKTDIPVNYGNLSAPNLMSGLRAEKVR